MGVPGLLVEVIWLNIGRIVLFAEALGVAGWLIGWFAGPGKKFVEGAPAGLWLAASGWTVLF